MKKTTTTLLLAVAILTGANAVAQTGNSNNPLTNTKWIGIVNIPTPFEVIFDYKKDTVNMVVPENNVVGESMKYSLKGDTLTIQKLFGNSPCNVGDIGKYLIKIENNKYTLATIKDDCNDRADAFPPGPFVKKE